MLQNNVMIKPILNSKNLILNARYPGNITNLGTLYSTAGCPGVCILLKYLEILSTALTGGWYTFINNQNLFLCGCCR